MMLIEAFPTSLPAPGPERSDLVRTLVLGHRPVEATLTGFLVCVVPDCTGSGAGYRCRPYVVGSKVCSTAVDANYRRTAACKNVTQIASEFRRRMSEGMIFGRHGEYRQEFYKDVLKTVDEVSA